MADCHLPEVPQGPGVNSTIYCKGVPMKSLSANQVKLGFIGLGNMRSRIAQRLLDHGYQLSVYDLDPAKAEAIAGKGGAVAKNILELARTADVILSCLTN